MSLMLHAGAEPIEYEGLCSLVTPEPTATHVPVPHSRVVDLLKQTLVGYGHEVIGEKFGVTKDGNRLFGVLDLRSDYGDYEDTVGIRNSHDKSFPVGIGFGSRVFVCDNLAFSADYVIKRKHTAQVARDLPVLISNLIEPLAGTRAVQHQKLLTYKATPLDDVRADHAILDMYRQGVIGVQKIAEVLRAYEEPPFDWGDRTAWRLFNAATFVLAAAGVVGRGSTPRLHNVIDGVCEVVE